ncbi:MAG: hypothetical protein JHC76_08655 [Akkermansiaceae bacterium]|nr:hypothetical protein [Akkermansiaceae bacterium]
MLVLPVRSAEWKPRVGPPMTRWAKDVSPDKVLIEYPRPQSVSLAGYAKRELLHG